MEQPFHSMRAVPNRFTPQKAMGLVAAVLLQAGFVYALISGLAATLISKLPEELKVAVEQEKIKPKPPPPPPPQVDIPPPPVAPPPEINIQVEAPAPSDHGNEQAAAAGCCEAADQFASVSRPPARLRPEPLLSAIVSQTWRAGTTTLSFKIDTDGSVNNPVVAKSSGYDRLDQAAISCVGSWHYKPAIQDGPPVEVSWQATVKWKLH